MKRIVPFPLSAEEVYRALLDPQILVAWLEVDYASTGIAPLHLFEIEDRNPRSPWKFRGFIVENEPARKLRIEREDLNAESWRALVVLFRSREAGCEMELAWSSPKLDRLAEALLDPEGHRRLLAVLDRYPALK